MLKTNVKRSYDYRKTTYIGYDIDSFLESGIDTWLKWIAAGSFFVSIAMPFITGTFDHNIQKILIKIQLGALGLLVLSGSYLAFPGKIGALLERLDGDKREIDHIKSIIHDGFWGDKKDGK